MSSEPALEIDAVTAAAQAVDGLKDFGDDSHREPLQQLLWSLQHEAELNAVGRQVMFQRMVDILATRLRVQYYLQRFPEIDDEEIHAPLFIVGLPRTGTTMLHRNPGEFAFTHVAEAAGVAAWFTLALLPSGGSPGPLEQAARKSTRKRSSDPSTKTATAPAPPRTSTPPATAAANPMRTCRCRA